MPQVEPRVFNVAALIASSEEVHVPGWIALDQTRVVDFGSGRATQAIDLGNVCLLPAFVNAHTHLEFSHLAHPLSAERGFSRWIAAVVAERQSRTVPLADSLSAGVSESAATGSGLLGEIATGDATLPHLAAHGVEGVVFRESICFAPDHIAAEIARARNHLANQQQSAPASGKLITGLSPHAPYTVLPELLEKLVELSVDASAPMAMHIAETTEERQLVEEGQGPLADFFKERQLWRSEFVRGSGGIPEILRSLARAPRALVVHGNYLKSDELDDLAGHPSLTLVYCPRTHRHFGHHPHPWRRLRDAGGRVIFGTDSRASNPDLSLHRELQFLTGHFTDVPPRDLFRMATEVAATALVDNPAAAQITRNGSPRLTLITRRRPTQWRDPFADILAPDATVVAFPD